MDKTQEWFKTSYLGCKAGTQLLSHSIEPCQNYKCKDPAPNSCEGDRFQQCFLVYDPATDPHLIHIHYLSYVHAGYRGKVLRCENADYRYYILWIEEGKRRISCIDYVRYYGRYRHRHCNSWWTEVETEHIYSQLPAMGKDMLRKRLGLPDDWELDMSGISICMDGAPSTARYMGWYDYIISSDWRDEQTVLIDMARYTDDSWQPSQIYANQQESATKRLRIIEEELVARTWHPKRFLDWCIPQCEKEDLAD